MAPEKLNPIHPGKILSQEFLIPLNIYVAQLSKAINVPIEQLYEIVDGTRELTSDIALRLSKYFDLSEGFWLNIQRRYNLDVER